MAASPDVEPAAGGLEESWAQPGASPNDPRNPRREAMICKLPPVCTARTLIALQQLRRTGFDTVTATHQTRDRHAEAARRFAR